jgi:hypothetical protein
VPWDGAGLGAGAGAGELGACAGGENGAEFVAPEPVDVGARSGFGGALARALGAAGAAVLVAGAAAVEVGDFPGFACATNAVSAPASATLPTTSQPRRRDSRRRPASRARTSA